MPYERYTHSFGFSWTCQRGSSAVYRAQLRKAGAVLGHWSLRLRGLPEQQKAKIITNAKFAYDN